MDGVVVTYVSSLQIESQYPSLVHNEHHLSSSASTTLTNSITGCYHYIILKTCCASFNIFILHTNNWKPRNVLKSIISMNWKPDYCWMLKPVIVRERVNKGCVQIFDYLPSIDAATLIPWQLCGNWSNVSISSIKFKSQFEVNSWWLLVGWSDVCISVLIPGVLAQAGWQQGWRQTIINAKFDSVLIRISLERVYYHFCPVQSFTPQPRQPGPRS